MERISQIIGIAHNYRMSERFRSNQVEGIDAHHSAQGEGDHFSYFTKSLTDLGEEDEVILYQRPNTERIDRGRPEPELAVLLGPDHKPIGYAVANDFTLEIELVGRFLKENGSLFDGTWWGKSRPGMCALGPRWIPALDVDPARLVITVAIERAGHTIYNNSFEVGSWKWTPAQAAQKIVVAREQFGDSPPPSKSIQLSHQKTLPEATVLLMGTGLIVPSRGYSQPGDLITISCPEIGAIRQRVVTAK